MHRVNKLALFFSTFLIFFVENSHSIVGGRQAKIPPHDDPVVFVNHVGRFSRVEGYQNSLTGLYTFRGIRYADPPVRENRFLRPRMKRLKGDVDAKWNAPPCPQPDYYDEKKIIGDEDCLALNIFTPQMPDESTGLPVLLWIHGGGYRYGSAAQYGAEPLIQEKIIFVPIQYRLGTLGILGDGSKEFGGNVAMFDMHAALAWVQEYIKFFGGDPKQIKVVGHGSGASSAMYLSQSPMSRSSINGVVAMSGSSLSQFTHDENSTTTVEEIAEAHKCPHKNEVELVKCLRNKSVEEIILKDSKLQVDRLLEQNMIKAMNGMLSFAPTIEGKDDQRGLPGILTEKPEAALEKEPEKKIPLLIGVTKDETANGINVNEIQKIFKSGEEFLKATTGTLKLDRILNAPKQVGSLFGLPSLADYLKIPNNLSPDKILAKLIETTTDVFFNAPSVLSADLWGKFGSSYFYQFDHVSDSKSSGKYFLKPLPLVSKRESKSSAHGDDLGLLFDIYDVEGRKINETSITSKRDQRARKNFVDLLTKFAYLNSTQDGFQLGNMILAPFKSQESNFIKISENLSIDKNFRFCQLKLLGLPIQSAQKISCEFLSEGLKQLPQAPRVKDFPGMFGLKKN